MPTTSMFGGDRKCLNKMAGMERKRPGWAGVPILSTFGKNQLGQKFLLRIVQKDSRDNGARLGEQDEK